MKNAVRVLAVVVMLVSIVSVLGCSSGSDQGSFVSMMKILPENLSSLTFIDVAMLQADDDLISVWNQIKEQSLGEDVYGESVDEMIGFGMAGDSSRVTLYEGDFDVDQMTSVIERNSNESFDYKGVEIWTDKNASSTAVIDDMVVNGSSEDIQLCVDVFKGEGTSLYDNKDARDVVNRLPDGYMLGVMVVADETSSAASYGLLAAGMAVSKQGVNDSEISLLKFEDSNAAEQYMTYVKAQISSGYGITLDGQYLSITLTSERPDENESAYNTAYDQIQDAVTVYVTNNSGVLPAINGAVNISGYELQFVDICSLLTAEGGMLSEVPEGVASVNGSDNDNCDAGCDGCLDTNHYIWMVDESGYVYSLCVGSNCSEYNANGYQGVWP
jgi:hypothetical protein